MQLIYNTIKSLAYVLTEPYYLIILVVVGIVCYLKNKKIVFMNNMIIGESSQSALDLTLSQIVIGIFGGILASILLTLAGVVFEETSYIQILFVISIILMFIKPRYICFSYSAAILGFISILVSAFSKDMAADSKMFNIDITMLMSFVAILHIVEALLVVIDGHRSAIPVFSDKNGTIIGGFALKRNWIVPIAIFIAYTINSTQIGGTESISTPGWWPIITSATNNEIFNTMAIVSLPLWGVIGYSSVTFTKKKEQKSRMSALCIFLFGIVLLMISQIARLGVVWKIIVVILTPLCHEVMLRIQNILESKKQPKFVSDNEGYSILEVVKYSRSYEFGFRSGDKVLSINGENIESEKEIYKALKIGGSLIKIISDKGVEKTIKIEQNSKDRMGILIVPKKVDVSRTIAVGQEQDAFSNILKKVKNKK